MGGGRIEMVKVRRRDLWRRRRRVQVIVVVVVEILKGDLGVVQQRVQALHFSATGLHDRR